MCSSDIFLAILAILFPPIAVWIKSGICSADSLINILLCTLGYIPGLLHAWYIISLHPEPSDYGAIPGSDEESNGAVTYYYIAQQPPSGDGHRAQRQGGGYGSVGGSAGVQQQPRTGGFVYAPQTEVGPVEQRGGDGAVPPSYEQATGVQGDHKVQK